MPSRIRFRNAAFREIRRLPAVRAHLHDLAEEGAAAAGEGYVARSDIGRNRARAAVIAAWVRARRDNADNHTLMRVIDDMRR